ncbi:MAG: hypothetical protein VX899_10180 [Myxococcota bacterium]|nr:hypothetical protein [Myxococcota bacterium]
MNTGLQTQLTHLLERGCQDGAFQFAMLFTDQGLPLAQAGEADDGQMSVVSVLAQDILGRARTDLGLVTVDEVTVRDTRSGIRLVLRPISGWDDGELLLLVGVPGTKTWRRVTSLMTRELQEKLEALSA